MFAGFTSDKVFTFKMVDNKTGYINVEVVSLE